MSLLSWLFGRGTQLATEGADAGGTPTGDELQAYTGVHEFPAYVKEIIGEFKPQAVTITRKIQMRYSPDVAFMSALVRAPIVNMRWTIESDDPEISAGLDAMIRPGYVSLAKSASLALLYGYQVIQPVYEVKPFDYKVEDKAKGESKSVRLPIAWVPKRMKGIDPRTLTLKADPKTEEFLLAEQEAEGKTIRVPAEQLILWTHGLEDNWGRLTGFGVYSPAYDPWYAQAGLILLRNSYFERRADPTPIGYFRDGQGTDEKGGGKKTMREIMSLALAAIRSRSFVLIPGKRDEKGNRENEITYLADDKRGDMFQQAIDAEGVRILKCGLIPGESATSEPMGSRARAEVHENRLGEIQQTRVDEWCGVLTIYAKRLAGYHWPAERVEKANVRIKASGLAPGVQQLYKEVLTKIMDAESLAEQGEAVPLKKRIDAVGMADDLGLPLRPLDEAQEEWDEEREAREAKAAEIAESGGMKITKDDEDAVARELSRIGAIDDEPVRVPDDLGAIVSGAVKLQLDAHRAELLEMVRPPAPPPPPPIAPASVDIHLHQTIPAPPITVNQGDVHVAAPAGPDVHVTTPAVHVTTPPVNVHQGDVHVDVKSGQKKSITITGPDGKETTGTITPEGGA